MKGTKGSPGLRGSDFQGLGQSGEGTPPRLCPYQRLKRGQQTNCSLTESSKFFIFNHFLKLSLVWLHKLLAIFQDEYCAELELEKPG